MEATKNKSSLARFKRIKPRKLSDDILEQIKSLIFRGELNPGEKLPPERDLAEYFDVGRSSVREALIRLSAVGLIETRKTEGYFVRSITEDMMGPLKAFIEDEMRNLIDFMEVRKSLDIWCAIEAIKKGTEEDFRISHCDCGSYSQHNSLSSCRLYAQPFIEYLFHEKETAKHSGKDCPPAPKDL
jgi:DNA-binding FadR family transcriptional regulator